MKRPLRALLVSLLSFVLLLSAFSLTSLATVDSSTTKSSPVTVHPIASGALSIESIEHYSKLKAYYKRALKQLKKQYPKTKSEDLLYRAYLLGYEDYVRKYLDRTIIAYEKKGWLIPSHPLEVYLSLGTREVTYQSIDSLHGNRSTLTIYTNYSSIEKLQHDIAHETFHWIHSANPTYVKSVSNRWQNEMLADYAPRYAVIRSDKFVGEGIGQDFLKFPLTYDPEVNNRHKFQAAQLLKYIDKKTENFDLNLFWLKLVSDANNEGVLSLEKTLLASTGKSLLYYYRYFASYLLFSSSSPVTFSEAATHSISLRDPMTNGMAVAGRFDLQSTGIQTNLQVSENYSTGIWALTVNFDSSMKKTQNISLRCNQGMTAKTAIDIYKTKSSYLQAKRVATILDGNSEVRFSVKNGDKLYIVVANGENQPKSFNLLLNNAQNLQ